MINENFDRQCRQWIVVLLLMAVVWRLLRFLLRMPIWGDEAMLDLNIMNRPLADMCQPLMPGQVAPPLFLIGEWLTQHFLGSSEYAVRLLPLLAGLVAVILFWRFSRMLLNSLGALIAVGFFAVGYYPTRYSLDMKPYSMDQMAALCLYVLATAWLLKPRPRYLLAAAVLMPLLFGLSYPVVFVAGGLCLAVLVELLKRPNVSPVAGQSADGADTPMTAASNPRPNRIGNWFALLACAVATLGSFFAVLKLAGAGQYQQSRALLLSYWHDAFPPHHILKFLLWFIRTHAGNMLAYPVGGKNGGSTATLLVFLVGLAVFFRHRRRWLVLLLTPFVLTFIAAVMKRYPYGGSARVAQHLAPVICLLAGAGIAWLVERFVRRPDHLRAVPFIAGGLLLTVGIGGALRDVVHPYKTPADETTRTIVAKLFTPPPSPDGLVVLQPMAQTPVNFQVYLRWYGQVFWNGQADRRWLAAPGRRLILVNFDSHLHWRQNFPALATGWQRTREKTWLVQIGPRQYGPTFAQVIYLRRQ